MFLSIIIAFFSLIFLIILHELGHFLLAKKFGVPVEEFGIGFPPKIFAKKIGNTVYSLNLLPLGAFVKIYGEEGGVENALSFSKKPIWQRVLIILGGVISFWIVAILILTLLSSVWGLPVAISDDNISGVQKPKVQIFEVFKNYPAKEAGILPLDIILKLENEEKEILPTRIKEVQDFIQENKEREIKITLLRGKEKKEIKVKVGKDGKIGIGLVLTGFKISPWYLSLATGTKTTYQITLGILISFRDILYKALSGKPVEGLELRGPIGIGELVTKSFEQGIAYFFYFIALISIYLAIFNLLPIPAVDGGKLLFLSIEKIRGKPINPSIEQRVNNAFFIILLLLLIFVTIKDMMRLF